MNFTLFFKINFILNLTLFLGGPQLVTPYKTNWQPSNTIQGTKNLKYKILNIIQGTKKLRYEI